MNDWETLALVVNVIGESPVLAQWFQQMESLPTGDRAAQIMIMAQQVGAQDASVGAALTSLANPWIFDAAASTLREHGFIPGK
jgi:hypothetical protein